MIAQRTTIDRGQFWIVTAVVVCAFISLPVLPEPVRTVLALVPGLAYIAGGSAWSYSVLTDREATRPAIVGAIAGASVGLLVLALDTFVA